MVLCWRYIYSIVTPANAGVQGFVALDSGYNFYKAKLATARFYFARLLPETAMLIRQARSGAKSLLDLEAELF